VSNPLDDKVNPALAVEQLMKSVNIMGSHVRVRDAFLEVLKSEHRTIQQDFWSIMFDVIYEYSKTEYYDGRNEQAIDVCKKLTNTMFEG